MIIKKHLLLNPDRTLSKYGCLYFLKISGSKPTRVTINRLPKSIFETQKTEAP